MGGYYKEWVDTMIAHPAWVDIDITDTMIAHSVFSHTHKIKKSAQASQALHPAGNMVNLWDFKEHETSGVSKDQQQFKNKCSRKNPLARGQFLNFDMAQYYSSATCFGSS